MNRALLLLSTALAGCNSYGISDNPLADAAIPIDLSGDLGPGPTFIDDGGLPYRTCGAPSIDPGPLPPIVAIWDGYSDFPLPSGADGVHVVIRSDNGTLSGVVVYGSAAPPAPPTDSETCYPVPSTDPFWGPQFGSDSVVEGFPYPLAATSTMSDVRLYLQTSAWAPWADWCACQVPVVESSEGGWACLPNVVAGSNPQGQCHITVNMVDVAVPCCTLDLCLHIQACLCTETACSISDASQILDLSVNGNHADGKDIHLTRTQ